MEGYASAQTAIDGGACVSLFAYMDTPTPKTAAPPVRVISRKTGLATLDLGLVWEYRDLLTTLSFRDLQLRYRQTALGAIWVVLQPLMAAVIFTFVFNRVAGLSSQGVPPFLFTFSGMLAWGLFSGFLGKASSTIVGNMNLVTKVYFPRLILPLSGILSLLVDFGVGFVVFLVMSFVLHHPPTLAVLALPIVALLLLALALGLSLIAAAMQVKYRDVSYVVPVAINMLLFISPIGYALASVGEKVPPAAQGFYMLNPLVGLMEMARWSMIGTKFPSFGIVLYSVVFTVVMMTIGLAYFKTQERGFADVI